MYKNVELRKLPADALCKVVNILEINDDWKKFMSIIPKSLQCDSIGSKYNNEHIRMIEEYAKANNMKCTEILMDEWGTSGRVRPTLTHLKNILKEAQMYRAADEIAQMLQESLPERPTYGPAAPITTNVTEMLNDESMEQRFNNMGSVNKSKFNEMCNKTTRQMKSASDMIEFSKNGIRETYNVDNQKSESDFIKFSKEQQQTQVSMNVPDISAMLKSKSNQSIDRLSYTYTDSDISNTSYESKTISSKSNNIKHNPNIYQTSFPDINISMRIDSAILQDENLTHFEYNQLETITGNFSETLYNGPNGLMGRIGSGGFGDVFVGNHFKYGLLAVKKAHSHLQIHRKPDIAMTVFNTEVKYLSQFRHNNIVPIIGFSKDGPAPCIVCEYIDGGSLQQNIEAKILSEIQRINIMIGTAEGLKYLHTSEKPLQSKGNSEILGIVGEIDSQNTIKNFVHGDVKTANILLTKEFVPKLCDFGLAKQYDSTFVTTCPMGTSAYMAPEGIHGTITQKIDIFSFGIVLLELLTGLKPIVANDGENLNIKHYVEENSINNDISHLLDSSVETWTKANEVYNLAQNCLEYNRKSRPTITEVANILYRIKN
ncbi:interleukin-1 receptor-associated kinase 4-like [Vanessa atalanta]|uniref:interleukin-1 receptor-associated kinase 4-like n=1 Tax=Vanessa atalanta TaxID=42275 RepID=UPI001FCD0B54|nr:interleukin-1 receptor-associated kinase 4-like [Vanessa atalanta]